MPIKCQCKDPHTPATPDMDCFINSPEHYNCFEVYKYYLNSEEHTLHECAKLMSISHTTVKQIELSAIKKLRDLVVSGQISEEKLKAILNTPKS